VRKLVLAGTKNHHMKHSRAVNAEPDLLHLHQLNLRVSLLNVINKCGVNVGSNYRDPTEYCHHQEK
jgi:hypothetical protein